MRWSMILTVATGAKKNAYNAILAAIAFASPPPPSPFLSL